MDILTNKNNITKKQVSETFMSKVSVVGYLKGILKDVWFTNTNLSEKATTNPGKIISPNPMML